MYIDHGSSEADNHFNLSLQKINKWFYLVVWRRQVNDFCKNRGTNYYLRPKRK